MGDAFRLGGWGMYPTTIVGLILIAIALLYAARPDPRRLHVVRCLSVLTLFVSCLGFVTGVIKTFTSVPPDAHAMPSFVVIGVGESLSNIGLGLVVLVIAWIAASVGASRSSSTSADLADPHGP